MPSQLSSLVDAHAAGRDLVQNQVYARVAAAFAGFDGWYNDRLVAEVSAQAYAAVLAGQKQLAGLTDAYLARVASIIAGTAYTGAGVALQYPLRGVSGEEEFGRVAATYRRQQAAGADASRAASVAADRARRMASADLRQAFVEQSKAFMVGKKVDGYRRIVHPELARTGSCGLCFVAADREYHKAELLPVHNDCNCGVLPIIGGNDPGQNLDIGSAYDQAESTAAADLKNVRIKVVNHSELGPQLEFANRKHRT